MSCQPTNHCTGVQCCLELDIIVTKLFVNVYVTIDPCDFKLSIGFGKWSFEKNLVELDWSVERTLSVANSLQIT